MKIKGDFNKLEGQEEFVLERKAKSGGLSRKSIDFQLETGFDLERRRWHATSELGGRTWCVVPQSERITGAS